MRRLVILILALLPVLPAQVRPTLARSVTDMAGRVVELPERIERIACLEVLCYPRMFMLGAASRVAVMYDTAAPWMTATNPQAASIPRAVGDANAEDLLVRKVDVAFFRYTPEQTQARLAAVGIPALMSQPLHSPETVQDFLDNSKRMVRMFGQVLGGEAETRAEDWCAYFDERVRFVTSRVASVPAARRVRLYYLRGPQALNTQGRGSYTYWIGTLAGGDMVVRHAPPADKVPVAMEDMVRWDPEVILVGRQYPLELVLDDPRWKDVSALRNRRVLSTPEGVFYWDGGPETVLLLQFVAKLLYPDLFADFDMAAEVKAYYARFYRADLTDADVARLLNGQAPDGSRFNPMNN